MCTERTTEEERIRKLEAPKGRRGKKEAESAIGNGPAKNCERASGRKKEIDEMRKMRKERVSRKIPSEVGAEVSALRGLGREAAGFSAAAAAAAVAEG